MLKWWIVLVLLRINTRLFFVRIELKTYLFALLFHNHIVVTNNAAVWSPDIALRSLPIRSVFFFQS